MKRKKQQEQRKLPLQSIAFACTILAVVLVGAWFLFPKEMQTVLQQLPEAVRPDMGEKDALQDDWWQDDQNTVLTEKLTSSPASMQASATDAALTPAAASKDKDSADDADESEAAISTAENPQQQPLMQNCSVAAGKLHSFFNSLDRKAYIRALQLKQSVRQRFEIAEKKLAAKTPTVVRETDDLYTVLSNTAHFFRILGKEDIQLLKTVLEQEHDNLEELAAGLYSTSTSANCPTYTLRVPFSTAYEYAVFFLNTIGGRSYLFRRTAKVRLLANYYAVLLIDQANQRNLNAHGLDLSDFIPPLIHEIEATNQLVRKDEYLSRLHELTVKYPLR